MSTRVSKRNRVLSYRDNGDYRLAGLHTNNPSSRFVQNENRRRFIAPKNECFKKRKAHSIISSNTKRNPSQICKYWINGNCIYGDCCWNLHSWFQGDGFSVLTKLHQHKKIVTGITLPDGSDKLYSSGTNRTLREWDCHTGQCVNTINLGDEARCLISMGSWVLAGVRNAIKALNIQTGAEITLDGPKGLVLSMAFCNDILFVGAMDGVIYAWRLTSEANYPFKQLATLKGHTRAISCLTIGCGDKLYSGSMDHSIMVWDVNTLQSKMTLKGHADVVTSLICWDQYLLSSSLDITVKIWAATEKGTLEQVYTHHKDNGLVRMNGMKDANGKPVLFCSSNNHSVALYEMPSFIPKGRLFSKQEIRVIEEGPDGLFFTGDSTGLLTVWKWQPESSKPMSISP